MYFNMKRIHERMRNALHVVEVYGDKTDQCALCILFDELSKYKRFER